MEGKEDSSTHVSPGTIAFNVDSPDHNFPVLELDSFPNCIKDNFTQGASEYQDDVDILIPSSSVLYSRSAKLVSAVQMVVKENSCHEAPMCKPLTVNLQEAKSDQQLRSSFQ